MNYIDTTPTRYSSGTSKNEVFGLSGDCANDCLETAGCYSFSDDGANCLKIIGPFRDEGSDQSVVDSGKLSSGCDNSAVLTQSFTKVNERILKQFIINYIRYQSSNASSKHSLTRMPSSRNYSQTTESPTMSRSTRGLNRIWAPGKPKTSSCTYLRAHSMAMSRMDPTGGGSSLPSGPLRGML